MKKNYLSLNIKFWVTEKYLPTKRHRKLRLRLVGSNTDVRIVKPDDFPVAFIVHDYAPVYEGAKSYDDFDFLEEDFRIFPEEIRTYNGRLFKPVRVTYGAAISTEFETSEYIAQQISGFPSFCDETGDFTEDSIIKESNVSMLIQEIEEKAEQFVFYDGKFWQECREPMYHVQTFGLGNNHGGTGFFISMPWFPDDYDYNALQREEAIAHAVQIAADRGDTKSIAVIKETPKNIEVRMPEMVRKPK